jgi:hypothetical protein
VTKPEEQNAFLSSLEYFPHENVKIDKGNCPILKILFEQSARLLKILEKLLEKVKENRLFRYI